MNKKNIILFSLPVIVLVIGFLAVGGPGLFSKNNDEKAEIGQTPSYVRGENYFGEIEYGTDGFARNSLKISHNGAATVDVRNTTDKRLILEGAGFEERLKVFVEPQETFTVGMTNPGEYVLFNSENGNETVHIEVVTE